MLIIKHLNLGEMETNCYILHSEGDSKAIIIDPAEDFPTIKKYLDDNGLTVEYIILTHAHFDHIGAFDQVHKEYNPKVIMNREDRLLLTDSNLNLSFELYLPLVVNRLSNFIFVGDEKLTILGLEFTFIHTPGHSPGSQCIMVENVIFTGDTLFFSSIGNQFPPYGDLKQEISSIRNKLYTLDKNYICYPGHGSSTDLDYEREYNPYTGERKNGR